MSDYEESCKGCLLAAGLECVVGGVVHLDEHWMVNHYGGAEGFLGWMALQPRAHRMSILDLTPGELSGFGPAIQRVQRLLTKCWRERFPRDELTRVYVTYFFESVFNEPTASPYHLHVHLIPRPTSLDPVLREATSKVESSINAWKVATATARSDFPKDYRKNDQAYKDLMDSMRKASHVQ